MEVVVAIRKCNKCSIEKSLDDDFHKHPKGRQYTCKLCANARAKEWNKGRYGIRKAKDPMCHRRAQLRVRYGLTVEHYKQMEVNQGGRCLLCGKTCRLVVDHNHATGQVRGLLCSSCNKVLGYIENQEWMKRTLSYLGTTVIVPRAENKETKTGWIKPKGALKMHFFPSGNVTSLCFVWNISDRIGG